MSQFKFSDPEQESKFQEIFEEVNQIDYSAIGKPCLIFQEKDLRLIFCAGMEFGMEVIRQDFSTYLQEIEIGKRYRNE